MDGSVKLALTLSRLENVASVERVEELEVDFRCSLAD